MEQNNSGRDAHEAKSVQANIHTHIHTHTDWHRYTQGYAHTCQCVQGIWLAVRQSPGSFITQISNLISFISQFSSGTLEDYAEGVLSLSTHSSRQTKWRRAGGRQLKSIWAAYCNISHGESENPPAILLSDDCLYVQFTLSDSLLCIIPPPIHTEETWLRLFPVTNRNRYLLMGSSERKHIWLVTSAYGQKSQV